MDAHHPRFAQTRALARKVSDEFTVPLCRIHHRAVHRAGDERAWWAETGIDPGKVANTLWKKSRGSNGHALQETVESIRMPPGFLAEKDS